MTDEGSGLSGGLPGGLFEWRAESAATWAQAAESARKLLAEVEAGRVEGTDVEVVALRTFVATVEGMGGV